MYVCMYLNLSISIYPSIYACLYIYVYPPPRFHRIGLLDDDTGEPISDSNFTLHPDDDRFLFEFSGSPLIIPSLPVPSVYPIG